MLVGINKNLKGVIVKLTMMKCMICFDNRGSAKVSEEVKGVEK